MFYQTFLSPQVKRSAIISNEHGIYELLHEFSNDLTLFTAFSPLGGSMCPHKKKKTLFRMSLPGAAHESGEEALPP